MSFPLVARTSLTALLLMFALQGCAVDTFTKGVRDPQRTQGLKAPAPQGEYELIALKGPGTFLSASVTKQGGASDLTFVILDIDGRNVVNSSIAAARNAGLTESNPYILNLVKSTEDIKTLTIGQPSPLYFEKDLKLRVKVNENGVVQVLANLIHGK